ncbi:MAG: 3'(2'),5'-bisphosphate nucleotidase CysQ [Gammaproteobacteria bacterium]|nr:3'(2'),5'-bisphosphate nucleotidase CysQ [Gammaproteobacteria bacterium]
MELDTLQAELTVLLSAVRAAGEVIQTVQNAGFTIQRKMNNDILTQADLEANDVLKKMLLGAFPDYGWLSEECVDASARLSQDKVWIVDPIDGTKEFAHGIPEYAISVALVVKGKPHLAVVYNPATNELFHAIKDGGAWQGNQRLHCAQPGAPRYRLLASRTEFERGHWDRFVDHHEVKVVGSIAYKLALVAAGHADATFSLGFKSEWDIAAGILLVTEAGGIVTDQKGAAFSLNQKNVLVDGIVASASHLNTEIHALIAEHH